LRCRNSEALSRESASSSKLVVPRVGLLDHRIHPRKIASTPIPGAAPSQECQRYAAPPHTPQVLRFFRRSSASDKDLVGAIVVDLAKGIASKTKESKSRTTVGMLCAATLLHQYVTNTLARDDARPSSDHCIIFRSYRQERVSSQSNYRRMLRNVEQFVET
jgi:hypothetical protein